MGLAAKVTWVDGKFVDMKAGEATADLLVGDSSDSLTNETITSLGLTADAFASRLKRKLREQERQEDALARARELRHQAIMKAMMTIRRALQETCKTDLGKRFFFELDVSDYEGWPKIELNLLDRLMPDKITYGLVVSGNDRNEIGAILLSHRHNSEMLGRLELANLEDLNKLPTVLKTALRRFLDTAAQYVLNPISEKEIKDEGTIEESAVPNAVASADVFSEEGHAHEQNRASTEDGGGMLSFGEREQF